jgi:hypothetical protein
METEDDTALAPLVTPLSTVPSVSPMPASPPHTIEIVSADSSSIETEDDCTLASLVTPLSTVQSVSPMPASPPHPTTNSES